MSDLEEKLSKLVSKMTTMCTAVFVIHGSLYCVL